MPMRAGRWVFVLAALFVAGCSETDVMDIMGAGKNVPDERLVRTNPPLSVPPDLRLPPPGQGGSDAAASTMAATSPTDNLITPPQGTPAGAAPDIRTASAQNPAEAAPQDDGTLKGDFYDVYRKKGISLYHPDGRRKTIAELNRELQKKIIEEKRRKNPNYGTIFNIGSIFK